MFQSELDVDETLSQLLVAEGFTSLEEVAYVQVDEIAADRRASTRISRPSCRTAPAKRSSGAKTAVA